MHATEAGSKRSLQTTALVPLEAQELPPTVRFFTPEPQVELHAESVQVHEQDWGPHGTDWIVSMLQFEDPVRERDLVPWQLAEQADHAPQALQPHATVLQARVSVKVPVQVELTAVRRRVVEPPEQVAEQDDHAPQAEHPEVVL